MTGSSSLKNAAGTRISRPFCGKPVKPFMAPLACQAHESAVSRELQRIQIVALVSSVPELGNLRDKDQVDGIGRAVAVLGNDNLGLVALRRVGIVVDIAVNKH